MVAPLRQMLFSFVDANFYGSIRKYEVPGHDLGSRATWAIHGPGVALLISPFLYVPDTAAAGAVLTILSLLLLLLLRRSWHRSRLCLS